MRFGPFGPIPNAEAVLGQADERLADAGGLAIDHEADSPADGGELLGGRQARGVAPARLGRPPPHQPGHADQEELVQV